MPDWSPSTCFPALCHMSVDAIAVDRVRVGSCPIRSRWPGIAMPKRSTLRLTTRGIVTLPATGRGAALLGARSCRHRRARSAQRPQGLHRPVLRARRPEECHPRSRRGESDRPEAPAGGQSHRLHQARRWGWRRTRAEPTGPTGIGPPSTGRVSRRHFNLAGRKARHMRASRLPVAPNLPRTPPTDSLSGRIGRLGILSWRPS